MKDLTFLTQNYIAHRGLHSYKTGENTLLSFKEAILKKYIIELDVNILKDGEIIVFHDYNLKRLTGIDKNINELTYKELQKITLKTGEHIPKFKEVLDLVSGRVPLLIEIKGGSKIGLIEKKLCNILDFYTGQFAIQAFNPLRLLWFKKNRRDYVRGQLVTLQYNYNFISNFICKHMVLNPIVKPHFISCSIKRLPNQKIRNKYILIGWTIRTKEEFEQYKNECDNLIFENIKIR